MTYQELKSRLEKCEYALKCIKDGTHKNIDNIDIKQTTQKLTLLKESLIKQMKSLDEGNSKTYLVTPKSGQTSAVSMSDDEIDALKDADDVKAIKGVDGEEIKENVEFSIDETKAIAKKVGEAVAKSLKSLGDDVASMKGKNIEPNSFEIYVQYKNGKDDEFSFYISNDKLNLTDFSFNKELVDVGVKPSGEPIINVDVLVNELNKHFKSLGENVEEGYYDNYKPKHFDICPGAETLRKRVLDGEFGEQEPVVVGKWTELHDELFAIEKLAIKKNFAQDAHVRMANDRRDEIIHLSREMNIPEEAIGYLKGHVDKIIDIGKKSGGIKETKGAPKGHYFTKSGNLVKGRLTKDARERGARLSDPKDKQRSKVPPVTQYNEAPDDMYYIKVKRTDKASLNGLQDVIETWYSPVKFADIVDDDGAGNVIFYLHKKDWDPGMEDDIMGNGVQIVDTNMPLSEANDKDDYGRPHVDPKGSRTYIDDPMTDYMKRRRKENDYYQDPDYYKENKSEDEGGDLDIGHQDDEPDMLKQHAYDIAQYAAKLYKALDKYDKYDGEVDFPNWWQSKLILARDYISKAQHYLEFEEKQPAIDQLALENVDKVAGGIPYKREGNKIIISEPLDDATKERIMKRAKEHGHHAAPNQAGGVTIMAKEGKKASDGMTTKIKPSEGDPTNMAYTDAVKEMMVTNQETGEDITKHVVALLKGEIDKKQFEKLTGLTKEGKYKSDAQRKAIYATKAEKGELKEELSDDQRDALEELERILDQAGQLGGEARDIIAQSFPNYLSQGDAYGAFNFGDSSNSYDTTLSSIVQSIYDSDEEEDMDEDNNPVPQGKNIKVDDMQFMHDQIVSRMKMLAKIYKEKGPEATVMLGPNNDRKVKVVDTLKLLTKKKRELEDALQKKVAGIGVGQELDEGRGDMDDIKSIISDRAANSGFEEREEAAEVIAAIAEEYMLSLKVIQAYMDSDGPVNPHDVYEAELSKKERSKLKDIVKQLKKSVKGHDAQQKYISTLVKEKK